MHCYGDRGFASGQVNYGHSSEIDEVSGNPGRKLDEPLVLHDIDEVRSRDASLAEIAPRIRERGERHVRRLVTEVDEKCIRGLPAKAVFLHLSRRKIPQIPGQDDGGAARDSGRHDMAIIGIRQSDSLNMSLVSRYYRAGQRVVHKP